MTQQKSEDKCHLIVNKNENTLDTEAHLILSQTFAIVNS